MNNHSTRRRFLKSATGLFALAYTGFPAGIKKDLPLLSFSTLGCPDWTFEKILDFAVENKYNGIEIRGIQRELDLIKCPEFSSPENIRATRKRVEEKGLSFVDLGSSAALHHLDPVERQKNLNEGKRFIDLARQLNCPYIRVFPNNLPKDQDRNATLELIAKGLLELGNYAEGSKVTVLMETHGEVVATADLKKVMGLAEHPHVGLIWDVYNMWSVTKEPPAGVYESLKKYILHTHIKDAKPVNGTDQYTMLGKGQSPIFEAIDILWKGGYHGYYSFEWEKMWHPEIAEPEIALADYPKAMKEHFEKLISTH
jgi:sugar phosphate isomerase/epimerase